MYPDYQGLGPKSIEGCYRMSLNWKQWIINIIKYAFLGFLVLLIVINIYLGLSKGLRNDPIPKFLGISPLIVLSGSMQPAINPGDIVVIREQPAQEYKLGDVATYLDGSTAFTHRIVGQEAEGFVLKGDNNNVADDIVPPERFLGKVVLRIPKAGLAVLFFKTPVGMVLLCVLLILTIYGDELFSRGRRQYT
jgi:signal peptidase